MGCFEDRTSLYGDIDNLWIHDHIAVCRPVVPATCSFRMFVAEMR